ncbi:MAG: iron complex outerrane recepter protein [Verrucomicrobiota bacterium]
MCRSKLLVVGFVQLLVIGTSKSADAPPAETLEDSSRVIVTGQAESESLTSPPVEGAAEQHNQIPGGFTVRSAEEMARGRASNFEDLLKRTPGLFLQTDNGTEVTRVSIRGSGILSEDEPLGVQFLLDGLTLNQADGEAILEDFDLATVNYAEVFRGSNAFKYGSITLGGAINLVTMTGYEIDPFQIRLEGGSFGYFRGQLTFGGVAGRSDYIGSVMGRFREGFRDHSTEDTKRIFGDVGSKFSDHLENRFYVTLSRVDRQLPGGLTRDELNDNPRQAKADAVEQDFHKQWEFVRLADKISYRNNGYEFDAGLFWFHRNVEERGFFEPDFRQGITAFYSDNYGITLNFVTHDELFGRRNIFTIGASPQLEIEVSQNFENLRGHRGQTTALNSSQAINAPLYLENQHYLTGQLSLLLGMQAIYAQRRFEDHFLSDDQGDQSNEQDFYGWNPKAGLIYELDKQNQVFLNFAGSWQPPSFNNMVEFEEGDNSSVIYRPLHPQRGQTLEVGTRGEQGRFEWQLSFYRTWLRNELLELNDANGNEIGAVNVERSFHQGIEAGLDIELLDSVFPGRKKENGEDRLTFSQTYTLNDFHFDNNFVYRDNRIAGVPQHFYEAELLYATASGFYAGPNLQCNLTRYPVDQANTLFADSYALLGFKIGYRPKKGFSIFFEAKNLTNKRFASAVDPIADARTGSGAQVFHPGDGRAFYGGVSWNW